jgi:serpin B
MIRNASVFVCALALAMLVSSGPAAQEPTGNAAAIAAVAESANRFAIDLYQELDDADGNLFLSPYSIYTLLAMLSAGAGGETARQIDEVMHLAGPADEFRSAFAEAREMLLEAAEAGSNTLTIASSLWPQAPAQIDPAFRESLDAYQVDVYEADFQSDPSGARRSINDWTSHATDGRIPGLLDANPDPRTVAILANVIYFVGEWATPFQPRATHSRPFHLSGGMEVDVPMMGGEISCSYFENDAIQAVNIPYRGAGLSMLVVLPREPDGLRSVENEMTVGHFREIRERMDNDWVGTYLPRFSFDTTMQLGEALARLGMADTFDPQTAELSALDGGSGRFWIDEIVHQTSVTVDERGTEVVAATGGGCFPAGTLVMTPQGYQPIDRVQPGTIVVSFDSGSAEWLTARVTGTQVHEFTGEMTTIRTDEGTVESTGNHPFCVAAGAGLDARPRPADLPAGEPVASPAGRWVEARNLRAGDRLLSRDGHRVTITDVARRGTSCDVYNLELAGPHNYCVGGFGALVHNKGTSEAPWYSFIADHPFLFVIWDWRTGQVLFMGRVEDPR